MAGMTEDNARNFSGAGGRSSRRTNTTCPLRKIVDTGPYPKHPDWDTAVEWLECGHYYWPREYAFGRTNAYRRRCEKCRDGKPPERPPAV